MLGSSSKPKKEVKTPQERREATHRSPLRPLRHLLDPGSGRHLNGNVVVGEGVVEKLLDFRQVFAKFHRILAEVLPNIIEFHGFCIDFFRIFEDIVKFSQNFEEFCLVYQDFDEIFPNFRTLFDYFFEISLIFA